MSLKKQVFNSKQLAFQELFVGTLIYAVVLGFFNDYTSIVDAHSFSTIFFASIVLELLTFLAFLLKGRIIAWLKDHRGAVYKILMLFCVWLIMFVSKFVFIWTLDVAFGSYININGFFGILLVVASVTVIHRLALLFFKWLGEGTP